MIRANILPIHRRDGRPAWSRDEFEAQLRETASRTTSTTPST